MTDHFVFRCSQKPCFFAIESFSENHICVFAEQVSGKSNKPWTQISWQQISLLTVSHCSGSHFYAKSYSALYLSKTGINFVTEAFKHCFLESYISEWKYYGFECTFDRHSCGLKDFRCWNCTIRTRNVGNMQNRWFSMEICIFSALFYCLEVYLTSSYHPKRPPEFCVGKRRIILKKSSLCVCGTLPKRPHRIILCRIILPWNDCMRILDLGWVRKVDSTSDLRDTGKISKWKHHGTLSAGRSRGSF